MKNWIGILILLLLGVFAWILLSDVKLFEKSGGPMKDFAIADTAKVDQIFISEPSGKKILLTRRGYPNWTVEGRYPARPDGIQLILKTLHDIKILSTVSKTTLPRVIARMASSSKKVEFYLDGQKNPEKVWYIGDGTFSRVGTYMLLEKEGVKSTEPFITHLLMERGTLDSRFFADSIVWKDRIVLKCNPKEIQEISILHKYDTATSYSLTKIGEADFMVKNLETGEEQTVNPDLAIPYFKKFQAIYYEYIDQKSPKAQLDSIYASEPRHQIKILFANGEQFEMETYNIPVRSDATLNDQPIDYHPERMYVRSSYMKGASHPIVQNLTFDPLISNYRFFASSTTVEK